ncbi:MAG: glutamine--fructose-6-phosphate transaminase (isomerizing) [Clostridia bacterium]|nr:glutamine--fructose-6-phosphate transaminase (isomerizing) [Clostridia bacterium]
MCGIVGYIGKKQAAPVLIGALKRLEYRGYDSAGIAVNSGKKINVVKTKGKLNVLAEKIEGGNAVKGTTAIGHTRWATHGKPSDINAHPHTSGSGRIAVVHNGIIENYIELKDFLIKKGYRFISETDTEVIAHLADFYYKGDLLKMTARLTQTLKGSYALEIISQDKPDEIAAVKKDSPLIIGLGDGENFIASDIPAVLPYTRNVYIIEDYEIALIKREGVALYNTELEHINKEVFYVNWNVSAAEKGGYEHFMIKEIMEEPQAILNTVSQMVGQGMMKIDKIPDKINIVACGSSYNVGVAGKYIIEQIAKIPVEVDTASEYRYRDALLTKNTLVVVISQSGETADTLAALRESKRRGAETLSIVNVIGSTIAREADRVLYTLAGPEISVATTKAYSTQLAAVYMLALSLAKAEGKLSPELEKYYGEELFKLPSLINKILEQKDKIKDLASKYFKAKNVFFIGRGIDYALSLEGALKLKEISYIHSEAYPAGELKHGPISLIEDGTLVVALATQEKLFEKTLNNIKEVKSRGAVVLSIVEEENTQIEECSDDVFYLPKTNKMFTSSLAATILQLFAYYVANLNGNDVDQPRNLAKSVTVE